VKAFTSRFRYVMNGAADAINIQAETLSRTYPPIWSGEWLSAFDE
jgi:hypothetical protein